MNQEVVVGSLFAFALTSLLLWILEPVARQTGLVDHPSGRKTHTHPTPLVGGIAMFAAFAFSVLTYDVPLSTYRLLFAGALLVVFVGVLDDLRGLSARQRFGAQIVASLLMAVGAGVVLSDLGHLILPGGIVSLGILSVPITVFAAVGVINAVNMSDGLDGLAASLVLVTVVSLGVIAWAGGDATAFGILSILAAIVLAFLTFNLRLSGRALVFMGDAGSMFLGFVLAWFLIKLSQGEDRLLAPVTALWVFALPLIDTVTMMVRRVLRGRSPFMADREHFHHILLAAGLNPKQTLTVMVALSATAACVGLTGHFLQVPENVMFFGFLGLFFLHFWLIMKAWKVKRFLARPLNHSGDLGDERS